MINTNDIGNVVLEWTELDVDLQPTFIEASEPEWLETENNYVANARATWISTYTGKVEETTYRVKFLIPPEMQEESDINWLNFPTVDL